MCARAWSQFLSVQPLFQNLIRDILLGVLGLAVTLPKLDQRYIVRSVRISSHFLCVQIGTAVFDPLLEAGSESVYLGMGDSGGVWNGSYVPTPHVPVGKPKQTDPVADLKDFSQLWRAWNALLEDGSNV